MTLVDRVKVWRQLRQPYWRDFRLDVINILVIFVGVIVILIQYDENEVNCPCEYLMFCFSLHGWMWTPQVESRGTLSFNYLRYISY